MFLHITHNYPYQICIEKSPAIMPFGIFFLYRTLNITASVEDKNYGLQIDDVDLQTGTKVEVRF